MFKRKSHHDGIDEFEENQKLQKAMKAIFKEAIYLILPRWFKLDVTYKVVHKGDFLYFCRCGGQFYEIDPSIAMNEDLTEEELLVHKDSFRMKKDEINRVEINSKVRYWTGSLPNNGSVNIITEVEQFSTQREILTPAAECQELSMPDLDALDERPLKGFYSPPIEAGVLERLTSGEKFNFIIHAINDYPQVQTFFEIVIDCPVTVSTDPKRE